MKNAEYYIANLEMTRHIEGGAYKENYRAPLILPRAALTAAHQGERNASTAIYFLLQHGEFSAFHLLASAYTFAFHTRFSTACCAENAVCRLDIVVAMVHG